MAFPTEPIQPLPTWATDSGALKTDPGTVKRAIGWALEPSTDNGEQPPLQYQNNEMFNNGTWATYFRDVARYIKKTQLKYNILSTAIDNTVNVGNPIPLEIVTTFNSASYYNTSTFIFTAPEDGLYNFSGALASLSGDGSPPTTEIFIAKNGDYTNIIPLYNGAVLGGERQFYNFSKYLILNSGDTIQFSSQELAHSGIALIYKETQITISWTATD